MKSKKDISPLFRKDLIVFFLLLSLTGCGRAEDAKPATPGLIGLKIGDTAPEIKSENWLNATAAPKRHILIVEFFNPQKYDDHAAMKIRWGNIRRDARFDNSKVGYVTITSATLHQLMEKSSRTAFPNHPVAFNKKLYEDFGAKDGDAFLIVDGKIAWIGKGEDIESAYKDAMQPVTLMKEVERQQ